MWENVLIIGKPNHVERKKSKLHKYFGIFKDGRLRKLLGLRYEWKLFESGEIYVLMSMNDKAEEIINHFKNYTGKNPDNYPSPGAPGTMLQKNSREMINTKEYRSLVGQTMFYSKKIAP